MTAKSHFATLQQNIAEAPVIPPSTRQRGSGAVSAPTQLAHFSVDFKNMQEELERLKKAAVPRTVKVLQLRTSPYQLPGFDEERLARLMANLAESELNTPIVVRRLADQPDVYEIVAGHYRTESFRRLGRDEIPATIVELTDEQAQALLFYDNLHAPALSDYEKFLHFKAIRETTGMTLDLLAKKAGLGKSTVGRFLSFDALPDAARAVIQTKPSAVGSTLAEALAPFAASDAERLVECVRRVVAGELSQASAVKWMQQSERPQASARPAPVVVKAGRDKYAELVRREGVISVRFKDASTASKIEKAIVELLQQHAKSK